MSYFAKKTEKPHLKAFRAEIFISLALMGVFAASSVRADDITAGTIIELVNEARKAANVEVLAKNSSLQQAAQAKAQDMIEHDYFAHVSPAGKSPWFWLENAGYDYRFAGENLAINYTDAKQQQQAWMESPLHRKNILNPDYQEIGVAVKRGMIDGHQTTVAVQMFGAKLPQVAAANTDVKVKPVLSATVAGADAMTIKPTVKAQKPSGKLDLNVFYQNNRLSLNGWLAAFGFAVMVVAIDVAALIHKKHAQLFILRDARNRHI